MMSGSTYYGFSFSFWEMYCALLQHCFWTTCVFSQKPPSSLLLFTLLLLLLLSRFSRVRFFGTPQTIARQALLSMRFSRQEYWSGLSCPPPGALPYPGIEPKSLKSPALAGRFFTWEAHISYVCLSKPIEHTTPRVNPNVKYELW